jgi:predicted ATPase
MGLVARLVRSARVVTLTGVGGVGKTRLALQAAAGLVGEFPGGVWLVELAPLMDAALVAATVASAVGAPVAPGLESTELVCRFLAQRRALLVLDNCEHVIDAAAALVDRLLAAAPRVRVLATSREALDVAGESAWRVPSLSLGGDDGAGDAVALFAERASHVHPGFSLADSSARAAAIAVCRRLDGIPLAIELAAARATVLSVEQIAAHLDERFRLLTRGGRTAVARQQTLQGAIDWSYDLLAGPERALFDTLGVFAGEFDLSAVAAVGGLDDLEALDLLEALVDKSMVEADPSRDRYRLLETLRQYAWEHLVAQGRLGEARDAHAACFLALAGEQAGLMGEGGRQMRALDRLEVDYDNLRAALAWIVEERRAEDAARMVRRLVGLFNIRHPREGLGWFRQVVAIAGGLSPKARARLLGDSALAAMNCGDREAEAHYAQAAIEVGGDDAPAVAFFLLGRCALVERDQTKAVGQCRRAVSRAAATRDLTTQASALSLLAFTTAAMGDEPEARRLVPEAVEVAERLGNPAILTAAYGQAAAALARIGASHEAVAMFERGMAHIDTAGPIMACTYRGSYALRVDDPHEAARILRPAIPIAEDELSGWHQALPLLAAANIAAAIGREQTAARLLGAFNHHGEGALSATLWGEDERVLSRLTDSAGRAAVEDEVRRGARLTIAQSLQLAEDTVIAAT